MRELKLSRANLADKAHVSRGYVSDLLNGKRGKRVGAEVLLKLAVALDVEPIFFSPEFASPNKKPRRSRKSDLTEGAVHATRQ